ncbi:MAG: flagellar basal body L-ring protein FlgH [Pseudomonadota bacterium]
MIIQFVTVLTIASALGHAHADSLYQEQTFQALVSDRKAHRPGDSLSVLVFENASASATADTTTEKAGGLNLSAKASNYDKSVSVNTREDFAGRGRIQRSGRLLAQITVVVQSVEPNGELNIKGEQIISVNNEDQSIRLEGRVRPLDISDTNTVPSSRIANARIAYIGDGLLAEKQRPGFLNRLFSWLGLI